MRKAQWTKEELEAFKKECNMFHDKESKGETLSKFQESRFQVLTEILEHKRAEQAEAKVELLDAELVKAEVKLENAWDHMDRMHSILMRDPISNFYDCICRVCHGSFQSYKIRTVCAKCNRSNEG